VTTAGNTMKMLFTTLFPGMTRDTGRVQEDHSTLSKTTIMTRFYRISPVMCQKFYTVYQDFELNVVTHPFLSSSILVISKR
jgi:hypothetical protein